MSSFAQIIIGLFVGALIVGVLIALPDASFPQGVSDALTSASQYIAPLNTVVPIDTLINVLSTMGAIEIAWLAYKLLVMITAKFTHGQH